MKIVDINRQERECLSVVHDATWPGYVRVEFDSKRHAPKTYVEWYPVAEFVELNPMLSSLVDIKKQPAPDDLGVVSKATETSLTDSKKKWKTDMYKGFPVWISRGMGEGQVRSIVTNTKSTVTIDKSWDVKPDKTSQYVISFNIHDSKTIGNTLPS